MSHHAGQTDDPFVPPLQGGCACGYIRYALDASPLVVHCCHCTSCQRETGSAFALNAVVEGEAVALLPSAAGASSSQPLASFPESSYDDWTPKRSRPDAPNGARDAGAALAGDAEGKSNDDIPSPVLVPVPAGSGAPQHIARCPSCFTPVWSNYNGSGPLLKFLRVGTLDAPALIGGPDVYIFLRSKQPFVEIADDGKPRFDAFYQQKEGVWRPEGLKRREGLLARIREWEREMALGK